MKTKWMAVACLTIGTHASAYEPFTHEELSAKAANGSVLNASFLKRLGLKEAALDSGVYNRFNNSESEPLSVLNLIRFGANWEDKRGEKTQSTRHFFNPINGEALSGNAGPYYIPVFPFFYSPRVYGIRSPDWALEDVAYDAGILGLPQRFSYRFGRRYFFDALTAS